MRSRRKTGEEPIFQPSPSVASRRDNIDKSMEMDERPLWMKIVLGISTAALLPGALGGYNILQPGGENPYATNDRFDREPSQEQQALQFLGQDQVGSEGPPRQQQQPPPASEGDG